MYNLQCSKCRCRHQFESAFVSADCPQCGQCVHYWELGKPGCDWCFGALYYCSNCRAEDQSHEAFCPNGETAGFRYLGTITLKAWPAEERREPARIADENNFVLVESPRSGWNFAVWVADDVTPEAVQHAQGLVNVSSLFSGF